MIQRSALLALCAPRKALLDFASSSWKKNMQLHSLPLFASCIYNALAACRTVFHASFNSSTVATSHPPAHTNCIKCNIQRQWRRSHPINIRPYPVAMQCYLPFSHGSNLFGIANQQDSALGGDNLNEESRRIVLWWRNCTLRETLGIGRDWWGRTV